MSRLITLGIETSCDETAVAVLEGSTIVSSEVASSMHLHRKYGGVVPEIATRYHVEVINYVFKAALKKARIRTADIDMVAVTQGPGLIGALLVGIAFAKALSYSLNVPLVGTNHVIAHLAANFLTGRQPRFPFIGLVASGGHSSLMVMKDVDRHTLIGQTQDDAAGEAFDKVAKILGLGYPGGPLIDKEARKHGSRGAVKFSIPSASDHGWDFSFSGIKTAVLYHVGRMGGVEKLSRRDVGAIAAGFQEAVCDCLARKAIGACKAHRINELAIGGGVSANTRLRERLTEEAAGNGIRLFIPPFSLCLDNAAMVARLGGMLYQKGIRSDEFMSGFANFNA